MPESGGRSAAGGVIVRGSRDVDRALVPRRVRSCSISRGLLRGPQAGALKLPERRWRGAVCVLHGPARDGYDDRSRRARRRRERSFGMLVMAFPLLRVSAASCRAGTPYARDAAARL